MQKCGDHTVRSIEVAGEDPVRESIEFENLGNPLWASTPGPRR